MNRSEVCCSKRCTSVPSRGVSSLNDGGDSQWNRSNLEVDGRVLSELGTFNIWIESMSEGQHEFGEVNQCMINRRLQSCYEYGSGRQQHLCNEEIILRTTPFCGVDSSMLRGDKFEESVHIQYCCDSRVMLHAAEYKSVARSRQSLDDHYRQDSV